MAARLCGFPHGYYIAQHSPWPDNLYLLFVLVSLKASLAVIQAAAHLVMVYVPGLIPDIIPGQAAASGVGIGLRVKAYVDIIIHQSVPAHTSK